MIQSSIHTDVSAYSLVCGVGPRVTDPKELEARFQQVCGHGWKKKDIDGDCFSFFLYRALSKLALT